jgi:CDP-2,3-bis-(O-geranylgeranyl)-sn-glycerol synthase
VSADPAAFVEALTILIALSAAGLAHGIWMRSPRSLRYAMPLDGGHTFRGRRIFGDNKTLRGFMVLVPAAGCALLLLGVMRDGGVAWLRLGLWGLDPVALFGVSAWAGLCFMAGELPNSFLKRQWGIEPGQVPRTGGRRLFCLVVDRLDSTLAVLLGMTLVVDLRGQTWLAVLLLGPAVHFGFSVLLYRVGVKRRYA